MLMSNPPKRCVMHVCINHAVLANEEDDDEDDKGACIVVFHYELCLVSFDASTLNTWKLLN